MTQSSLEARIRERAYRIWQQEGCPEGRSEIHWEMAREFVAIEENQHLAAATIKLDPTTLAPA